MISGTKFNDSINNFSSNVTIQALNGGDILSNYAGGLNALILGGEGSDSIYNYAGTNSTINGGASNDYIWNNSDLVTISGGEGDDSIHNNKNSVSIDAGKGKDSIKNYGSNVTITGGADNDSIYNDWSFFSNEPLKSKDGANVLRATATIPFGASAQILR